jgi:hypothetical protein
MENFTLTLFFEDCVLLAHISWKVLDRVNTHAGQECCETEIGYVGKVHVSPELVA